MDEKFCGRREVILSIVSPVSLSGEDISGSGRHNKERLGREPVARGGDGNCGGCLARHQRSPQSLSISHLSPIMERATSSAGIQLVYHALQQHGRQRNDDR